MKNHLIYSPLNIVLQRISDAVRNGHTHYVSGSCPMDKLEQLLILFDFNYQAMASKSQREKRKRHGLGNVHLVMWYHRDIVHWWLLATPPADGRHPIHETDNLRDALVAGQRIEVDRYELVRLPKEGTAQTKLTWRMTEAQYENFRSRIVEAVRSRSHHKMDSVLYSLWSCPGFNGIRVQIGKLAAFYRAELKRSAIKNAPEPPDHLYYLNRIKHSGVSAKQLLAQVKAST